MINNIVDNNKEKMDKTQKKTKSKKLKIFLVSLAILIVTNFISRPIDDYVVRTYLFESIEEGYGIRIDGSNWLLFHKNFPFILGREYIFSIGTEDKLEVVVSLGRVVSSRKLNKLPIMWFGTDFRFSSNDKWR